MFEGVLHFWCRVALLSDLHKSICCTVCHREWTTIHATARIEYIQLCDLVKSGKHGFSLIWDGYQFFGRSFSFKETPALRRADLICPSSVGIMRDQLWLVELCIFGHGEILRTGYFLAKSLKILMDKDKFILEIDFLLQRLSCPLHRIL